MFYYFAFLCRFVNLQRVERNFYKTKKYVFFFSLVKDFQLFYVFDSIHSRKIWNLWISIFTVIGREEYFFYQQECKKPQQYNQAKNKNRRKSYRTSCVRRGRIDLPIEKILFMKTIIVFCHKFATFNWIRITHNKLKKKTHWTLIGFIFVHFIVFPIVFCRDKAIRTKFTYSKGRQT